MSQAGHPKIKRKYVRITQILTVTSESVSTDVELMYTEF